MGAAVPKDVAKPKDGRSAINRAGFSYLPRFIHADEADALIDYFGNLVPLWEQRYHDRAKRSGTRSRRLTRPVYWLGAWQFACLGYYAEPWYRQDRCLRAEAFPPVMAAILSRLQSQLIGHDGSVDGPPNSCLINYYGREIGEGPPRDYARLRMHRDGEPGPVVMFSIGQPGLLEFVDPKAPKRAELAVWTRHRSVSILSGTEYKDRLYHRITQARYGDKPAIPCQLDRFEARRISVSFRYVPEELIVDLDKLSARARAQVMDYVERLAIHSPHFRDQLARVKDNT